VGAVRHPTAHLLASVLVVAVLGGTVACTGDDPPPHAGTPPVECPAPPVPTDLGVTCHRIEVDGASLAVAVLHAEDPTGLPVLHLHGGPGGRSVADRHRWLAPRSPLLARHDVVLVDQRGGGLSTPSLDCPEVDGTTAPGPAAHRACRDRLDAAGVDRVVTVDRIARDLVTVRTTLGIDRWHLHGVSYGTRIALELLRIDDGAVASAVLDSVVPPDVATHDDLPGGVVASIAALGGWCADPARPCGPGLPDRLGTVLGRLATDPATVTVASGDTLRVDDVTFLRMATDVLAGPVPRGPLLAATAVDAAHEGRLTESVALLVDAVGRVDAAEGRVVGDARSEGSQLSVECTDEFPGNRFVPASPTGGPDGEPEWKVLVAEAVRGRWLDLRTLCALWDASPSNPGTRLPVRSPTPVLVLAGELDPITPLAWARHLVDGGSDRLVDALLVTSDGWSHVPTASDPCAVDLMVDFLASGRRPEPGPADCPPGG